MMMIDDDDYDDYDDHDQDHDNGDKDAVSIADADIRCVSTGQAPSSVSVVLATVPLVASTRWNHQPFSDLPTKVSTSWL